MKKIYSTLERIITEENLKDKILIDKDYKFTDDVSKQKFNHILEDATNGKINTRDLNTQKDQKNV
ncbi:MAG: hypothetical protein Q8899_01860 [Weeping tea tree witches'-broom phytoplasma]|uniref:hypothetical protein n=1 Tax=Candidatus Phytoplasma melaleucae TaxID=2982630 RepID=UPI00293B6E9D|nr:hypothetical protein [Weeping tea tree witches'-broom phytoplasma]